MTKDTESLEHNPAHVFEYFAFRTGFFFLWLVGRDFLNVFSLLFLRYTSVCLYQPFSSASASLCLERHTCSGAWYTVSSPIRNITVLVLKCYALVGRAWLFWFHLFRCLWQYASGIIFVGLEDLCFGMFIFCFLVLFCLLFVFFGVSRQTPTGSILTARLVYFVVGNNHNCLTFKWQHPVRLTTILSMQTFPFLNLLYYLQLQGQEVKNTL